MVSPKFMEEFLEIAIIQSINEILRKSSVQETLGHSQNKLLINLLVKIWKKHAFINFTSNTIV